MGRIIRQDDVNVRYVSSGFWSRIDDELDGLRQDSGCWPDDNENSDLPADSPSVDTKHPSFLFGHSLSLTQQSTKEFFPLASQIPFLLQIFIERVNYVICVPHLPTLRALIQQTQSREGVTLTSANEALLFSVYYAAIGSMENDEVQESFGITKENLLLRFRSGLEVALANADFLNNPNLTLLEALVIFLSLARRNDSPRFVWMMTGLAVRVAHFIGLHQDGSHSQHFSPFETEMRRRVWWNLCTLDMRATQDQGTDLAIPQGSFTTQKPRNVNDSDLSPDMQESPSERQSLTDSTLIRLTSEVARTVQEMAAEGRTATFESHSRRLIDLEQYYKKEYFCYAAETRDPAYMAMEGVSRIVIGKLNLVAFLPILLSSSVGDSTEEVRTRLLVSAIEVAEYNHALNTDPSCSLWRWAWQTHQQWHAVVYLLIESCRRPWSFNIERAWQALHSPWLIPARAPSDKNFDVWVPLQALMTRARRHRKAELSRLRTDSVYVAQIEEHDKQIPTPSSSETFPAYFELESFRTKWQRLVKQSSEMQNRPTKSKAVYRGDVEDSLLGQYQPIDAQITENLMATGVDDGLYQSWFTTDTSFLGQPHSTGYFETSIPAIGEEMNSEVLSDFDWNSWFQLTKSLE